MHDCLIGGSNRRRATLGNRLRGAGEKARVSGSGLKAQTILQPDDLKRPEPRISGRRTVAPARLSEAERTELSRELYRVHRRIFTGPSAREFRQIVVEPHSESTVFQLYFSATGQLVGYCAIHTYRRQLRGREVIVIRADAGLLPEYRGRGVTFGFGMFRALNEKLRHPLTPVYYLDSILHASGYHLLCRYFPRVFPHPLRETPAALQDIAQQLVESFRGPAVTESDPFVRDVGWATIESPQEKALNRREDRLDVQYFNARNPGCSEGHGLAVIVPMTFGTLCAALLSRLGEVVLFALSRRKPEL